LISQSQGDHPLWGVKQVRGEKTFLFENSYTNVSLGSSLSGGKEALICSKRIIPKFQM